MPIICDPEAESPTMNMEYEDFTTNKSPLEAVHTL